MPHFSTCCCCSVSRYCCSVTVCSVAIQTQHWQRCRERSLSLSFRPSHSFLQDSLLSLRTELSRPLWDVKLKNDSGYPEGAGNTINIFLRDSKCQKCRISPHVVAAGSASRDRFLQRLLLQCQIATIHCSITIATWHWSRYRARPLLLSLSAPLICCSRQPLNFAMYFASLSVSGLLFFPLSLSLSLLNSLPWEKNILWSAKKNTIENCIHLRSWHEHG